MVRFTLSMQDDSYPDCGGPHFEPGLVDCRGRLIRLHKGGDNGAAIREQKLARQQSAKQFAIQMELMAKQAAMAASVKTPVILPAAPPQQTSDATLEAARDQRRQAGRRFSFSSARMAGSQGSKLGGSMVLGGGYSASA